ncbi:MAG: ribbon-helix-helix protein, CopG family [Promethearchaeota archaeon]
MNFNVTISAKISEELKKKIEKYKINTSQVIRDALDREIKRIEQDEMRELLDIAGKALSKIGKKEIVKSIREDRDTK